MNIFKRHNLGLISAILLMAAVVACRGETPLLPSPSTSSPSPTLTSTPTLQPTPSPTDIIETPTTAIPRAEAPCLSGRPIEERAREALANWLGISSEEIEVIRVEEVEWPDTSLGCPEPGMVYAQVIVPGCRVVMRVGDEVYEYHSGGGQGVLCDQKGHRIPALPSPTGTATTVPSVPTPARGEIIPTPVSGDLARLIDIAKEDLARRLETTPEEIEVVHIETAEWPDTSLGCGKPGLTRLPVAVPGYRVVLSARGWEYVYHTGRESGVVYCPKG